MSVDAAPPSSPDGPWPSGPASFPTTRWSRILAARDGDPDATEARGALADLCRAYWYPLYAFIRRRGHDPEDARDLTQEFFARLIEADFLAGVDRAGGSSARSCWPPAPISCPIVATSSGPRSGAAAVAWSRSTRRKPRGDTAWSRRIASRPRPSSPADGP